MTKFDPNEFDDLNGDRRPQRLSIPRLTGVSSSHFLRMIEERANVGFWTSEFATDQLTLSKGVKRLMGMEHIPNASYQDLVALMHPDDKSSHENMRELVRMGQPVDREFRIIRADGMLRWIRNIAEVMADRNGVPIRAVGLCMDVTDQHEASRSVAEGWKSYKTLVSAIAPLQWRNLPDGQVVSREGWKGIVGDCFDGTSKWLQQVHSDDRAVAAANWTESLATGKVLNSRFRLRDVNDEFREFIARAAPILDDHGAIREWLGVLIPVGEPAASKTVQEFDNAKVEGSALLEASQIRAARAFLHWTHEDLAIHAGISVSTVRRMESDESATIRSRQMQAVRDAFIAAGISFSTGPGSQRSISFTSSACL